MTAKQKRRYPGSMQPFNKIVLGVMGAVIFLVWGAALSGCAGNYGRLTRSPEVTAAFQAGRPLSDYDYYYSGREGLPYALIGVAKEYRVPSKLWKAFTPTTETLMKKVAFIHDSYNEQPYGAYILDPSGERIGVWYSRVQTVHAQVDHENQTISVVFTDPEMDGGEAVFP